MPHHRCDQSVPVHGVVRAGRTPARPVIPFRSGTVTFYKKPFFDLMLTRLHSFDGSMLEPSTVTKIEYTPPTVSTRGMKVIRSMRSLHAADGGTAGIPETLRAPQGGGTETVSAGRLLPIEPVPALRHYRLAHESPGSLGANGTEKFIKIFEYVPGARIPGEGVIELPLVSNGGRRFEYRQASIDGAFVVPYSTTGTPYDVRAAGRYRLVGTGREVEVGEDAVRRGLTIGV